MALDVGARLGPYEVLSALGAGGMGEVYKARDTRLDRTVAIKILPEALASDPQFHERFDREARALSQFTHPHICTLYDVGHEGGVEFLVLEHLDGATLESRLASGSLPFAEAMRIAIEIAGALAAAHRAGIVHRDLKPGNVILTKGGAKLLDFGLAKSSTPVVATSGLSMLPTTPPTITAQGAILGTFQYMAPEQIEGLDADARTDIFAFGCVLYEMLTGRKAFEGKTRASLLGAILKDTPLPVSQIQTLSSPGLDRVIATCLEKDPDDRYQATRDLLRDLKWTVASPGGDDHAASGRATPSRRSALNRTLAIGATCILTGVFVLTSLTTIRHARELSPSPVEFTIDRPESGVFAGTTPEFAVSPSGDHVVFVAIQQDKRMLWVRSMGDATARVVPGTDGADYPFWSPDGRQIGFFANGKLKRISLTGGPTTVIADATASRGGTWGASNVIVFSPNVGPLLKVSPGGGAVTPVTTVDGGRTELDRWPAFLPDGRHFLFTRTVAGSFSGTPRTSEIRVSSIDSTDWQTVITAETAAQYAVGYLFYARDGNLVAQPFDADSRRVTGDPFVVADTIATDNRLRYVANSVSSTGTLVYVKGGGGSGSALEWVDRSGKTLARVGESGSYNNIALSPDEKTVAVSGMFGSTPSRDIWLIDLARSVPSRFTFDPNVEANPAWSPDGKRIAYAASGPKAGLHVKDVIGASDEVWWHREGVGGVMDWSPDGQYVVYWHVSGQTSGDLWLIPTSSPHTATPLLTTAFNEQDAAFSPDGHWFAYASDESGRDEVYVQPFPPNGEKFPISSNGGAQPQWRADGKELFFVGVDGALMSATVAAGSRFEVGQVQPLFLARLWGSATHKQYVPSHNGQRFLMSTLEQRAAFNRLTVVLNWPKTIQK